MERIYPVYNYTTKEDVHFKIFNPFVGEYYEAVEKFLHYYSPDVIVTPPKTKISLKAKKERICRFCLGNSTTTSFRKNSHVMPKLMGNDNLIHDCECDMCNEKFGIYEDSLAKFIGMMRTADRMKGYSGIPKFKSADEKFTMTIEKDEKGVDIVSIYDGQQQNNYDKDNKSITLTAIKPSYVPLHVMKCLYKIGYSFLNLVELDDYSTLLKIINTTKFDTKLSSFARIVKCTLPIVMAKPFVVTFKKKEEYLDVNMPTKVVLLHFGRYVYQYFLLNIKDRFMYTEGEKCQWIYTPPYYYDGTKQLISPEMIDLSSNVVKRGEIDSVVFTFDKVPDISRH